ncbi:MAG: redoxin domain-containing protein [Bacteroidetes bacterium]|nr:redoxin domain-containing protein [Bacteroidota bacterium]
MLKKALLHLLFLISVSPLRAGGDSLIVYIFLSEGCPICQNVTPELNRVAEEFTGRNVRLIGIFPSAVSNEESRKAFADKYRIKFKLMGDTGGSVTRKLNASTTPEVIVVEASGEAVIYRGLIDDSYAAVGKRRKVSKLKYLKDALNKYLSTFESSTFTTPVGCKITLIP